MYVIDIKVLYEIGLEFQCFLIFSDSNNRYPVKYSESQCKAVINGHMVKLTGVEMPFGGLRYFFICPDCRDRKLKLVLTNSGLSCMSCLGIKPRSLNRSKNDCNYYWNMAEKVARSIDTLFSIDPVIGNTKFPDKPKGMHWETYSNKYMKYKEYKEKGDRSWMGSVGLMR